MVIAGYPPAQTTIAAVSTHILIRIRVWRRPTSACIADASSMARFTPRWRTVRHRLGVLWNDLWLSLTFFQRSGPQSSPPAE
jgi:hypothetical protein